jgi:hypothetical protein
LKPLQPEKEVKKPSKKQKTEEFSGLTLKTSTILDLDEMVRRGLSLLNFEELLILNSV